MPKAVSAGADTLLGPEMKSTGEVMGIDKDFSSAYAKASIAAGLKLPTSGNIFITMIDKFKDQIVPVGKQLQVGAPPCSLSDLAHRNLTACHPTPFAKILGKLSLVSNCLIH